MGSFIKWRCTSVRSVFVSARRRSFGPSTSIFVPKRITSRTPNSMDSMGIEQRAHPDGSGACFVRVAMASTWGPSSSSSDQPRGDKRTSATPW